MSKVARFSASVPKELLEEFDALAKSAGMTRSRALQNAMASFVSATKWAKEAGEVCGAVLVLYKHTRALVEDELTDAQHDHADVITSSVHVHLSREDCMQVIIVKGPAPKIKSLLNAVSSIKGVMQVSHTVVSSTAAS